MSAGGGHGEESPCPYRCWIDLLADGTAFILLRILRWGRLSRFAVCQHP